MTLSALLFVTSALAANPVPLDGTPLLTTQGDIPMQMVAGIDTYLNRALDESVAKRSARWHVDTSSHDAYLNTIDPVRKRFATIIGAVDPREAPNMEIIAELGSDNVADSELGRVYRVRWRVFRGVEGEGLLIEPNGTVYAQAVVLPDCDTSPEAFVGLTSPLPARLPVWTLAAAGCRVVVPMLINRSDDYSGVPGVRLTNQPHREFIYRTAYELGRHIIGYEVQKTLSAIDWLESKDPQLPTVVAGYGEGGLVAMYTAALATNIDAAVVSGYFQPRERVWSEPIYRSVWALLYEFGDAEIASLIAPKPLLVETCAQPDIKGPPAVHDGRDGAAPGAITTPSLPDVAREVERARSLVAWMNGASIDSIDSSDTGPFSGETIDWIMRLLAVPENAAGRTFSGVTTHSKTDEPTRMKRQVQQLVDDTQYLLGQAEFRRKEFWSKADASSPEAWSKTNEWYRTYFNDEAIGALPPIELPPNARTRLVYDQPAYRGYEVMLDVLPDVFAYGILLVPNDIAPGEKRPVVVCQHGLEGRVQDVADPAQDNHYYHQFACKLAEQGFVTYAPQNPYIGEDKFRVLQRKANPLKLSLFSFIVRQHEQTLKWLGSLPFVDADRIGFYGLSYGGKTAMRVPALLKGYCLSICSADYNEWIRKCTDIRYPLCYVYAGEDEMWEWNMGNTFNYAEMSWLIYPRPFMVERGHHDGVGYDEEVASEFARTKRHYVLLGSGDDAQIEYFNGPHTINGVGTFAFLHDKLKWP